MEITSNEPQNQPALTRQIELACVAEATAPKPGNVHPGAAFDDLTHEQFVIAANVAAPCLATAHTGVGLAIEQAVRAVRQSTGTNVNLGICLLIAPLAASEVCSLSGVAAVLNSLTVVDAEHAYRAIGIASPGGLGETENQDVSQTPTVTLLEAMKLAAEGDGIARLYATNFADLFHFAVPTLLDELKAHPVGDAIVRTAVHWQARFPDTHIARRCGETIALEASRRAAEVIDDWSLLHGFDRWLRADGHQRNPGTTADIIAAALFVAIRDSVHVENSISQWIASTQAEPMT